MSRGRTSGDSELGEDGAQVGVYGTRADESRSAISEFPRPRVSNRRTSSSRSVRPIRRASSAAVSSRMTSSASWIACAELSRRASAYTRSQAASTELDPYAADRLITGVRIETGTDLGAMRVEPCCGGGE